MSFIHSRYPQVWETVPQLREEGGWGSPVQARRIIAPGSLALPRRTAVLATFFGSSVRHWQSNDDAGVVPELGQDFGRIFRREVPQVGPSGAGDSATFCEP